PDPHVTVGLKCTPLPVEIVIRGYLAGHAWRIYRDGGREICGVTLPEGLKENDKLPEPIITPTTKERVGHDQDISMVALHEQRILRKKQIEKLEHYGLALFEAGSQKADSQDLILVDTKYEFGVYNDKIVLIDEIHTPDSSRYFYKDTYAAIQSKDQKQRQLSKEFVRQWLIENGFQGLEGQLVPEMTPVFVENVSDRYVELYEQITGKTFVKRDYTDITETISSAVESFITNNMQVL
ncbi:MAG: phosphoribosylaminoimidazole-succinocarboxamide synthase, partial [Bacteroidia bacterium]